MPMYDYKCIESNIIFTVSQSIYDEKFKTCKELRDANPHCRCSCDGKSKVKRLVGSIAKLDLRGKGFYCNDYKKNYSVIKGANRDNTRTK